MAAAVPTDAVEFLEHFSDNAAERDIGTEIECVITKANESGWMVEDNVALVFYESGEKYLVTVQEVR